MSDMNLKKILSAWDRDLANFKTIFTNVVVIYFSQSISNTNFARPCLFVDQIV